MKDTVSIEEYGNLETVLQKYESSVREHIKVTSLPNTESTTTQDLLRGFVGEESRIREEQ